MHTYIYTYIIIYTYIHMHMHATVSNMYVQAFLLKSKPCIYLDHLCVFL